MALISSGPWMPFLWSFYLSWSLSSPIPLMKYFTFFITHFKMRPNLLLMFLSRRPRLLLNRDRGPSGINKNLQILTCSPLLFHAGLPCVALEKKAVFPNPSKSCSSFCGLRLFPLLHLPQDLPWLYLSASLTFLCPPLGCFDLFCFLSFQLLNLWISPPPPSLEKKKKKLLQPFFSL